MQKKGRFQYVTEMDVLCLDFHVSYAYRYWVYILPIAYHVRLTCLSEMLE